MLHLTDQFARTPLTHNAPFTSPEHQNRVVCVLSVQGVRTCFCWPGLVKVILQYPQ